MTSSTTRGELTLDQLARLLPANESAAILQTTAHLLNLVDTGLLVPSRSEPYQYSLLSPAGGTTSVLRTRHFFTWGAIAEAAPFLPEALRNTPAVRAIIEATGNQPHNVTPFHGNNNQPPTPQATSRKSPSEVLPSDVGHTVFSKSQILKAAWCLPDDAPTMQNILESNSDWVVGAMVARGKPGRGANSESLWHVVKLARALAEVSGKKKWAVPNAQLTRVIAKHFSDALPDWEDDVASFG